MFRFTTPGKALEASHFLANSFLAPFHASLTVHPDFPLTQRIRQLIVQKLLIEGKVSRAGVVSLIFRDSFEYRSNLEAKLVPGGRSKRKEGDPLCFTSETLSFSSLLKSSPSLVRIFRETRAEPEGHKGGFCARRGTQPLSSQWHPSKDPTGHARASANGDTRFTLGSLHARNRISRGVSCIDSIFSG